MKREHLKTLSGSVIAKNTFDTGFPDCIVIAKSRDDIVGYTEVEDKCVLRTFLYGEPRAFRVW